MRQDRSARAEVHSVTSAGLSHTDDIALRQRRYILTQSVRIVCVVLATALPVPIFARGLLLVGAVLLPWFGVVMANAGPTLNRKQVPATVAKPLHQPERVAIPSSRVIDQD